MEQMRRHPSLKPKSRSKMCLYVDSSCCSSISSCMTRPFDAHSMKWWRFKKSSTNAPLQGNHHMGCTNRSSLPNAACRRSCSRSRPQFVCSDYKRKQALVVAAASVAAAEAAVIAAEAAAHMAQLTVTPASRPRPKTFTLHAEVLAAIKIQSAFRGHLVRKVIRVKSKAGLVRLQALAHGRVGQTQCETTMRCMQALVRAQQAGVRRQPCKHQLWVEEIPVNASTCMHNSSKEICHESIITHSNKEQLANDEMPHSRRDSKLHWNWLEHWMATRLHGSQNCHSTTHVGAPSLPQPRPSPTPRHATKWPPPLESWSLQRSRQVSYQNSSSASSHASGDVQSVASFSGTPSYMADTESRRAKIRAHSAPRQRLAAKCIPFSNSPLQQQPHLPFYHSSLCPRHLSHMTHAEHHHASTKRKY